MKKIVVIVLSLTSISAFADCVVTLTAGPKRSIFKKILKDKGYQVVRTVDLSIPALQPYTSNSYTERTIDRFGTESVVTKNHYGVFYWNAGSTQLADDFATIYQFQTRFPECK